MRTGYRQPAVQIAAVVSEILRALPICASLALVDVPAALGRAVETTALTADIPEQPLGEALAAFASQTGLQLVYVSQVVRNRKSHAVAAGLNAPKALSRLLAGTGLEFEYLTPQSIRILLANQLLKARRMDDPENGVAEVIVTANRRTQPLQDVPMTVEVLTNATLAKLNVTTFDDFVKYLPGVTAHGVGPAQNSIYVRGLGTGEFPNQAAAVNSSFPNVAVYLDEQSAQLPGRNLDAYAADLERIEVLEGPQGTLFGAGAEAGVLRYITNKPTLNVTEATAKAGFTTTAHGRQGYSLEAVINLPVITDEFAVRGVIYNERRGGYINNIPATFARADTDSSIRYANYPVGCDQFGGVPACRVPPNAVVANNANLVAKAINPVTYLGARVAALYRFNEDWKVLFAQSYQDMEADGVFTEAATNSLGESQPELTVQLFNPSYDKDRFENTALTIDGRLGALQVLYAGAYLVRNVDQIQDYTSYARGGPYVDYYQCVNPAATAATAQCFTPSSTWRDQERNTHQSHELRLTTPGTGRLRGVGGLFYERYTIQDQSDWYYLTALPYFNPIGPPTGYYTLNGNVVSGPGPTFVPGGVTSNNPNVRPLGDGFFNDATRGYSQRAAYASVDFDLIPRVLTLTAGTRYFSTYTSEVGSLVGSFGCSKLSTNLFPGPGPAPNPCINHSDFTNLNASALHRTFAGFKSRANLSWKVTEDALLYYTWSQGFRSGGFNRGFTPPGYSPLYPGSAPWQIEANQNGGWSPPRAFAPDSLTNNELGWKTSWFEQRLQWNGAIYQENWNHAQIGALDTALLGGTTINGGNYRVRGLEISVVGRIGSGLTVEVGAAWNHSELTKEASFFWANGTPIDFNSLETYAGQKLANPAGTLGSPLAGAPAFQGNLRARYEINFNGYNAFAQIGAVHQSHSLATTDRLGLDLAGNFVAYDLPPFTTYDGALGMGKDAWLVQLCGENLTDTRAELYANFSLNYKATTVNRPRTVGLRASYNFRGR
jgi:iron complex outermembrane recepter protein